MKKIILIAITVVSILNIAMGILSFYWIPNSPHLNWELLGLVSLLFSGVAINSFKEAKKTREVENKEAIFFLSVTLGCNMFILLPAMIIVLITCLYFMIRQIFQKVRMKFLIVV